MHTINVFFILKHGNKTFKVSRKGKLRIPPREKLALKFPGIDGYFKIKDVTPRPHGWYDVLLEEPNQEIRQKFFREWPQMQAAGWSKKEEI